MTNKSVILWYDTDCRLCIRYVDFIKRHDRREITTFNSIYTHTSYAAGSVPSSMLLEISGSIYKKSNAALKHWIALGGVLKACGMVGHIMPQILRDYIYDVVARNRYQWFGTCDCSEKTKKDR